ncbi:MAG: hypothetical protein CBB60_007090 [Armatimonadetes bacterium Cent15-Ar3]|nr:MAG: hypothetical protein CBB60_007090 [Armatimonadetes bacterium Cent15-Ar3]
MFTLAGSNETFAPMAFVYDEDHHAYEEPKAVKWLRARKQSKPYQANLSLRVVEGGLQETERQKVA